MSAKSLCYEKVSIEDALDETGFGIYSYGHVVLTGATILAFAYLAASSSVIVPTSACELATTSAQQGIIAAAPIVGLFIGTIPWGYLGDRYGRRSMLLLSLVAAAGLNFIRAISVNWVMLFVMEFLVNIAGSGQYLLSMALLSESIPMAKRNFAVLLVTSMFLPAQGLIAISALPIISLQYSFYLSTLGIYWNSWRTTQAVYSIPALFTATCLYFMPESPKFILSRGDEKRSLEILEAIYRRNCWRSRKKFPVKGLIKEEQKKPDDAPSAREQMSALFAQPLLKYTIILTILLAFEQVGALQIWFPTIANRFMQMVETGAPMNQTLCDVLRSHFNAPKAPAAVPCTLNTMAMWIIFATGSLQSVASLLVSTVVNTLGRRNIVIAMTTFCGLSGVLVNLVPNTVASAVLFIILLIGFTVVGLYTAIAVAIFPTEVRALAVSFAMAGGRVSTIASVQIVKHLLEHNCDAGFYIFSILFAMSAVAAAFLPDDRLLAKKSQPTKMTENEDTRF